MDQKNKNTKRVILNDVLTLFQKNKHVAEVLSNTNKEHYRYLIHNMALNHGYLLTYSLFLEREEYVVYVASNLYKANTAYETFCKLAGHENVNLYVVDELVSSELLAVSGDFKYERLHTIRSIMNQDKKIIVTHVQALLKPILSRTEFEKGLITLSVGQEIDVKQITKKLIGIGYKKTSVTQSTGEFSVRGEVLDIFLGFEEHPIRINLFDNEIETIKTFDETTQKSKKQISSVTIYPMNELIYEEDRIPEIKKKILKDGNTNMVMDAVLDLESYSNNERLNKYIKYITEDYGSLLGYVDQKIILYQDYHRLKEVYDQLQLDLNQHLDTLKLTKQLDLLYFLDFEYLFYQVDKKIYLSEFRSGMDQMPLDNVFSLQGYACIDYQNDIKNLILDLNANPNKTYVICASDETRLGLLNEILSNGLEHLHIVANFEEIKTKKVNLLISDNAISFGFFDHAIEVLTEKEIFKEMKYKKTKFRSAYQNTVSISSKEDLHLGDYVVHYDYGIAKYAGMKSAEVRGVKNDYIVLQYENMELYIPVEKINLLDKYQGSEASVPKLTKLGNKDWEKKKEKIREKVENIANDLIKVQAERERNKGFTYDEDNEFQMAFERDFLYEETVDQLKAITEIKKDMENGVVIDRLICGDVGYGKTEIAMRIAFKTVLSSKQVVYLAPTTILTRQHYYTFKERFEKYGMRIELLNRLIPERDQKRIIDDVRNGKVDVLIGTHRLLSEEIKYKDLGLLIVDEEQRFGVVHKEKIKKLKHNINVLTLTATPIPRTLQMSIMGVRQLSLISTPPQDRYPIQTYVLEENDIVIKEAIYRELGRGGQIFYLHNRIGDLDRLARKLKRLVPEARIIAVHGKMDKNVLEDSISAFIDREYDVLLCTTIIETGIDIPNSNTLIIDSADKLGLAQIYQIRGRVGRSDKVAYAYLMYDEDKVLTDTGTKRLSAIKEFTSLGSGYKIAVRDLAIRGAGDILGSEQSGFIDSVGLDMYMRMVDEAIKKVKGMEEVQGKTYKIDVSKHVSGEYVSDDNIRILIHKEIGTISSKEDKLRLIEEFTDRFGRLTEEILTYIEEKYLEVLLKEFDVHSILETASFATIILSEQMSQKFKIDELFMSAYKISDRFHFEYKNHTIIIKIKKEQHDKSWIYLYTKLFDNIKNHISISNRLV